MKLWETIAAGGAASGLPGFSAAIIEAVKDLEDRLERLEQADAAVVEGDELPVFRKARKV